ncbi:hypothetical protein Pmani_026433 [Petrolisthes manimaculis]|uniref:Uncharacterized protein n=1 Tax=Petrolisthes manimaculis TaxID=1843537 RepID=A0AAE1P4N1_9EUCA|nr:hypothetical protein Pmani_026433 [Petrolisthes manimaculis]
MILSRGRMGGWEEEVGTTHSYVEPGDDPFHIAPENDPLPHHACERHHTIFLFLTSPSSMSPRRTLLPSLEPYVPITPRAAL